MFEDAPSPVTSEVELDRLLLDAKLLVPEPPARGSVSRADIFESAPRELTWSVSLGQTLDIVRSVVDVVEEED